MPHASSWFSSSQDGSTQSNRTRRNGQGKDDNDPIEDDDDELAVKSERVSIKCPITLLVMKDPVTSGKCPHSFEKEAILSMINLSEMRSGGDGRRGGGVKAMKCPVCEVVGFTPANFPILCLEDNPILFDSFTVPSSMPILMIKSVGSSSPPTI